MYPLRTAAAIALAAFCVGCEAGREPEAAALDAAPAEAGALSPAPDAEASRGDAGSSDGAASDAGNPGERPPLKLRFEEIALEGAPLAITDFAFIPSTLQFLVLQKGGGEAVHGAEVLHYELIGDTARLLGSFILEQSYDYHDCGLIGLAFDPGFAENRYVYFSYCDSFDYSQVSRHAFTPEDYAAISASGVQVLRVGEDGAPNAWHNIGEIGFDPEGNLWALAGEKNDRTRAQQLDDDLGSVLRVRPRTASNEAGYDVVATNPFSAGGDGKNDGIVAFGLRSPWRGALDARGRLWIAEVGDQTSEEINVLRNWGTGTNFGWPLSEGPCRENCEGLTDPVVSWEHELTTWPALEDPLAEPTTRRVPFVGLEYVVREVDRYAGRFEGRMTYGDFCGGWVRAAELDASGRLAYDAHAGHLAGISGWDQASDGYAYVSTYGNCFTGPYRRGRLYRAVLDE